MFWNDKRISGIDMDATSKRIGELLDKSGITDKELGSTMGLSVQAINKWRHGRSFPDIENLYILSRILGVKVDDFLVAKSADIRSIDISFLGLDLVYQPSAQTVADAFINRMKAYARLGTCPL